ncbi:MAG: regulator [Gammaproteobacteria bacterium]|nr:regulator [Gammaproteobacteria bacterium]
MAGPRTALSQSSAITQRSSMSAADAHASLLGRPRVVEQFEVGKDVYVRALAVQADTAALWVGTSVGVHEIDLQTRKPRRSFTRDDGLANEYVFAIWVDRHGAQWFGTNAGGVTRLRDGNWKTWFPMHGLADYWVYAFAEQQDGTLWIGTWDGASRYDADSDRFTNFSDELINEWVYGIDVDSSNRVWFATEGGVSAFDGTRWQQWSHADGLGAPNQEGLPPSKNTGLGTRSRHDLGVLRGGRATYNPSYVFAIHVDGDNIVWAGTWGGGIARFDGERWTNFTTADGLAGNIVYSIAEARDGSLWFGTDAGLSHYDGERWINIGPHEGLIQAHVYAIAIAPDGSVWAGTRGGVVRIAVPGS